MTKPTLETKCPALSLPQRYCFFKDQGHGICNERTRYECQLWRELIQPVHQRQYTEKQKLEAQKQFMEETKLDLDYEQRQAILNESIALELGIRVEDVLIAKHRAAREDTYWKPNPIDAKLLRGMKVQLRRGREDNRNYMRARGSYNGYLFEGEKLE